MFPATYPPVFLPASTSIRVVLPAPVTPIRAVRTPGLKDPLTPFKRTNLFSTTPWFLISCKYLIIFNSQYMQEFSNGLVLFLHYLWHVHSICYFIKGDTMWFKRKNHSSIASGKSIRRCISTCTFVISHCEVVPALSIDVM